MTDSDDDHFDTSRERGRGRRPEAAGTPARHTDPRRRRDTSGGRDRSGDADRMLPEMISLGEIEQRLIACDDELARLVDEHFYVSRDRAHAEADWKSHLGRVLVKIADAGDKGAQDIREARARATHVDSTDPDSPTGEDLYRTYKVLEAAESNTDRAVRALQTRMMGLMAVAKGVRGEAN